MRRGWDAVCTPVDGGKVAVGGTRITIRHVEEKIGRNEEESRLEKKDAIVSKERRGPVRVAGTGTSVVD